MNWKKELFNRYIDYRTFNTFRRLLVIESDDWGSIRTGSKKDLMFINKVNSVFQKDKYTQLDAIATPEDLSALFDMLSSMMDKNGFPAKFTLNVCTANPDFEKIKAADYDCFYYETFDHTIRSRKNGNEILGLWKQGLEQNLIQPQLHGREHLHALAWLAELKAGNMDLLKAFELNMWGVPYKAKLIQRRNNLQAALDLYVLPGEESFQRKWLKDGAEIFENYFGFKSTTFIPPAYIWHQRILPHLPTLGIKALQGIKLQYQPAIKGKNTYQRKLHYTGQKSGKDITYLVRNTFFEPALEPDRDWVDLTLTGIANAFKKHQPAIIGSHRVNFIGSLDQKNRDRNLKMLRSILRQVVVKWPEVEFMSSDQLLKELRNGL